MKRAALIILALVVSVVLGRCIGAHADELVLDMERERGDMNGDGVLSREDGTLLRWTFEGRSLPTGWRARVCANIICGDMNLDGAVDAADYEAIYALAWERGRPARAGEAGCRVDVALPVACEE